MIHLKQIPQVILLFVLLSSFLSCKKEKDCAPLNQGLRIMPLGDSRVEGDNRDFESYRFELWKQLIDNNWTVNFVGTRKDNDTYPQYKELCFDNDHEGTGGALTSDILQTVEGISDDNAPDVVLLGIGGNDLLAGSMNASDAIDNIKQIIDRLQSKKENIVIFLEQIAPGRSDFMTEERTALFNEFNANIISVANEQSSEEAPVILVDMTSGWSDLLMADEVHYNFDGAAFVANKYYIAIDTHLEP